MKTRFNTAAGATVAAATAQRCEIKKHKRKFKKLETWTEVTIEGFKARVSRIEDERDSFRRLADWLTLRGFHLRADVQSCFAEIEKTVSADGRVWENLAPPSEHQEIKTLRSSSKFYRFGYKISQIYFRGDQQIFDNLIEAIARDFAFLFKIALLREGGREEEADRLEAYINRRPS